jgi:predicted trehalose synthase
VVLATAAGAVAACGDDAPTDAERAATFCERLDRLTSNDPFAAFGDEATSAEVAAAFEALVERAEELAETAPDEARAAARDYAESASALEELLRSAGYEGAEVDTRAYRDQQARYAEAARRLERHLDSEC